MQHVYKNHGFLTIYIGVKCRTIILLTYWLSLPVQVVKKLCVAGKHAAARGTGDKPLLSVAPHVFSQTIPNLEESVAACKSEIKMDTPYNKERSSFNMCLISHTIPLAEKSLLLLCKRLLLSAFNVIVHMTVEPLRIVK